MKIKLIQGQDWVVVGMKFYIYNFLVTDSI